MDPLAPNNEKDYSGVFSNIGNQFGFIAFYPVKGNFHIGLLPRFSTFTYNYESSAAWEDAANSIEYEMQGNHHHKLRYIEIPLVIRYYIGLGKLKPYLEGNVNYGILYQANKEIDSDFITRQNGTENSIPQSSYSSDYGSSYIKSRLALGGGIGAAYDFDQLILTLDLNYSLNMNNITNQGARYGNQLILGSSYDVPDDIKLHNLAINLGIIFPINKITKRGAVECTYFKTR